MGFESKVLEVVQDFAEGQEFAVHAYFYDGTLCVQDITENMAGALLRTLQRHLTATVKMSNIVTYEPRRTVEFTYDFCAFHGSK